jgi:hypothetical protein
MKHQRKHRKELKVTVTCSEVINPSARRCLQLGQILKERFPTRGLVSPSLSPTRD